MYEDLNEEENEKYDISPEIMNIKISTDELDEILDKHLDKEEVSEEESEKVVMYILQLFYRSGRKDSCTTDIYEKYNSLIGDRAIQYLNGLGILEEAYDPEIDDYVYSLNEKGKKLANDNL